MHHVRTVLAHNTHAEYEPFSSSMQARLQGCALWLNRWLPQRPGNLGRDKAFEMVGDAQLGLLCHL